MIDITYQYRMAALKACNQLSTNLHSCYWDMFGNVFQHLLKLYSTHCSKVIHQNLRMSTIYMHIKILKFIASYQDEIYGIERIWHEQIGILNYYNFMHYLCNFDQHIFFFGISEYVFHMSFYNYVNVPTFKWLLEVKLYVTTTKPKQ